MWSEENLIIAAIILDEENNLNKKRKRKFWIHNMLKYRNTEGEYITLFKELMDDDTKFFEYFRMPKYKFFEILSSIEALMTRKDTTFRESIEAKQKLCVCLRFLATGDSFQTIAFSYRLGHSTVCSIVKEVCDAIIKTMLQKTMPPLTTDDWRRIADDYWNIWNFPNCLGALDGKHVVIKAPANSGSQFFNYKKTFSIVLLALVDARYNFITVDIGSYGKNSDGGIFAHSNLGKNLETADLNIPGPKELPGSDQLMPYVMVGDEAFPLKPYLLRPYSSVQQRDDITKKIFNYRLSRARRCSENAFGILGQKFQIYNRRLNAEPQYADKIVLTTCILHNYIRDYIPSQNPLTSTNCSLRNLPQQGGNATSTAFNIRDAFKDYLNSAIGAVDWQLNSVS